MESYHYIIKIFILACVLGTFGVGVPVVSFAYKDKTTHPRLTEEIVRLYNLQSSTVRDITTKEEGWIRQGSIDEDDSGSWVPDKVNANHRSLRHFYDPIHEEGMAGYATAKEWALVQKTSEKKRKKHEYDDDDYSWERAIYEYVHGDRKRAFESLGHVLHLIEDMTVPAHVRDDEHPKFEPYEEWANKYTTKNTTLTTAQVTAVPPFTCTTLDACFNKLAMYTNVHFFSKDTITNKIIDTEKTYTLPDFTKLEIERVGGNNYGILPTDKTNYLVRLDFTSKGKVIPVIDKDEVIMNAHWDRLSPRAVAMGVHVVELFFAEVEKKPLKTADFIKEWVGVISSQVLQKPKTEKTNKQNTRSETEQVTVDDISAWTGTAVTSPDFIQEDPDTPITQETTDTTKEWEIVNPVDYVEEKVEEKKQDLTDAAEQKAEETADAIGRSIEREVEEFAEEFERELEAEIERECAVEAAYASESGEDLETIRAFRDEMLYDTETGTWLASEYYEVSTHIAPFITEHPFAGVLVRELLLEPAVQFIGTLTSTNIN